MKRIYLLLSLISFNTFAQTVNITDADIAAGQTVNWTKDKVYVCDGVVYVESGATLNIEAGTVVKFTPKAEVGNPSALVICRGAKIYAEGTKENPIIFTAESDDLEDIYDLDYNSVSLWGGLVILGNGITKKNGNSSTTVNNINVEGLPSDEVRAHYGGSDNTDNSGVLKYVSIRHGGRELQANNELNGLTLGAVGSRTVLDYIEIFANSDDGIEFFGGAPVVKHAVVAFAEDDSFDWDEVFVGKGQFWFSIQKSEAADAAGEFDGSTLDDDATDYSKPTLYNWTHIGSGKVAQASNANGVLLRAGTAGTIANSIISEQKNKAIEVQDKGAGIADAYSKLATGELKILNNIFWNNGNNTLLDASSTGIVKVTSTAEETTAATLVAHLTSNSNQVANPMLMDTSRKQNAMLDPRPSPTGAAYNTTLAELPANDTNFRAVTYKGAFSSELADFWLAGWTALSKNGYLKAEITSVDSENQVANFTMFPNPATSSMNVSFNSNEVYGISIFNSNGILVKKSDSKVFGNQSFNFETADLNKGVYIVKCTNAVNGKFFSKKLVIE